MNLANAQWHTSTRSNVNGQCVEVAGNLPGTVAVRDSKDRSGPVLAFTPAAWTRFLTCLRCDDFGRA